MSEENISKKELAEELGLVMPKNITDTVMNTVKNYTREGQITLPEGYNPRKRIKKCIFSITKY